MIWDGNLEQSSRQDASSEGVTQRLTQLREKKGAEGSSISNSQHRVSDRLLAVTCSDAGFVRQGISVEQVIEYLETQSFPELIRLHEDSIESSIRRLPTQKENRNPTGLLWSGERRIASRRIRTLCLKKKTTETIIPTTATTTARGISLPTRPTRPQD